MGSQTGELFRKELAVLVKLDDKEQKYDAVFNLLKDYGDQVYFFSCRQQRVGISVCMNEITSPMHAKVS